MEYKEYKFKSVYEFADIIYKFVDNEVEFWAYDNQQVINAITRYNKVSLLHIYIYTQLLNYYSKEYSKWNGIYEEETFFHWREIALSYGIRFRKNYDEDKYERFYDWYIDNEKVFHNLFQHITNEVFYVLFTIHPFLIKFNKIVAKLIKNKDDEREWIIPTEYLTKKGTLKRCQIPIWTQKAVFHRDHGKCVFCGKDLTGQYSHSNSVNYDHIIPLNKYGANDPCNLQLSCEQCNKSKLDNVKNPRYKYEPWW